MDRAELGRTGEALAATYLERAGYTIVARNVRTREGEIDLIASRGNVLAFVEVKTRRSATYGSPAEAVTYRKTARIRRLALEYLASRTSHGEDVRFDVVDILRERGTYRVTHLENAF